ncbi:hypothetical protein [Hyalangium sp.]|nr:hypothetical protein [Hyalangium sp.]
MRGVQAREYEAVATRAGTIDDVTQRDEMCLATLRVALPPGP